MRRKRKEVPAEEPWDPGFPDIAGRPWWGLYCGRGANGNGYAPPESSMLVLGPPRSGKTTCIVIPVVLDAPAAVVSTSTKPDVLSATMFRRHVLGNCFVFDPTGTMAIPQGAYPLRWSPVVGCDTFEKAVAMARALASAARPASALSESAHWIERAEGLLAPLLYAANLAERDMATLCRWVLSRDVREPVSVLEGSGHEMAQAVLAGVLATEERERSGIFSTASGLLSAYRSDAALATTTEPNFDPAAFARSTDALYICAPSHAQEQLAPIVVALLEQIRTAVYARPPDAAPVIFALDEVASIAPLPSLPAMAAEGGGQGLMTLACLQDLSQARARWGEVADGFFSLFNQKLIFPGIGDQRTLALVSALAGDEKVQTKSLHLERSKNIFSSSPRPAGLTYSSTWRPRLPVDAVAKGTPGYALGVLGSQMDSWRMIPWFEHPFFAKIARLDRPFVSEAIRPELRTESVAPRARPAPNGGDYDGPTVLSDERLRSERWIWIANGSQSLERQFGPPKVRRSFRPKTLDASAVRSDLVNRAIESFRAEAFELDIYDPLLDEAPQWEPTAAIDVTGHQPPVGRRSSVDLDDGVAGAERAQRIQVRILGPVEVVGWRAAPDRPILTELVCYLALHHDRYVTGEALRAALRPDEREKEQNAKTLRTYLSMLRKSLGPDVLPAASSAGYRLGNAVTTDLELFAGLASAEDLETKLGALRLIRGQPFEGVQKGSYLWVSSEFLISDIEVTVSSHTREVAQLCWEDGRRQDAIWALRQGLLAARYDYGLWEVYLSFASVLGRPTLERARREATAALGDDAPLGSAPT